MNLLFEKLAEKIMKHSKLIICIWLVMLFVSVPFIYKVLVEPDGVLQYDMTRMGSSDSESIRGMRIISDPQYFVENNIDEGLLLVFECPTDGAKEDIKKFASEKLYPLLNDADHYNGGLDFFPLGFYSKNAGEAAPGISLYSLSFNNDTIPSEEVLRLRDGISEAKEEFGIFPVTYLTGNVAILQDTTDSALEDVMRIDPFSVLLVLILIGLFFRSLVSAGTPPLTIGFAYGIVMMVIFGLSQVMQIYYITSTLVLVSMLGAGCDYCIFIIARYREERKEGLDKESALRESIIWAGESITTSGLSVIIGFGVMSFCSFSMVSSMGIVLASGIIFALLAALTLIPSILMLVGDRIFYPSTVETYREGSKAMSGWFGKASAMGRAYFSKSAHVSIKYAPVFVIFSVLLTVPLAYVALSENTSYDMISIMPDGESRQGVDAIVENSYGGLLMPTYVLLSTNGVIAEFDHDYLSIPNPSGSGTIDIGLMMWDDSTAAEYAVSTTYIPGLGTPVEGTLPQLILSKSSDNIANVTGLISSKALIPDLSAMDIDLLKAYLPEPIVQKMQLILDLRASSVIDNTRCHQAFDHLLNYEMGAISEHVTGADGEFQYVKVTVRVIDQPMSEKSMGTVEEIKSARTQYMSAGGSALFGSAMVTGSVVATDEISMIVNNEFKWIEIGVVVLIFILLFVVMRSYFTPLRSIITIVMSVVWTLGATHLLFGHLLGTPVTWIVPIVLFVICLGLGMDYDILLTTRIKENVMKGMSNDDAILHAVEKSGAVITICGFIMGGAFLTMVLSTSPMLKEFGFALGFAILVDALFIRTYIVPAVMHLMGKWNWVGPKFIGSRRQ